MFVTPLQTRRRSRRVADTSTVLLSSGDELEESTKKVGRPKKTRNPPVTTVKASPAKKSLNRSYDLRSATKGFSAEITFSSDEEDGTPAKKTGPVKPRMTLSESKFKKQLTVNSKTASVIKASTPNKTTTRTQRKEDTPVKTRLEFDTEKRVGVQTRSMLRKQQEENDSFIAEASESDENGTTTKSKKEENETYPSWPEVGWKEFALAAVITATAAVGYICYSTDLCKYC